MNTRKKLIDEIKTIMHLIMDEELDKVIKEVKEDSILLDKLNKLKKDEGLDYIDSAI